MTIKVFHLITDLNAGGAEKSLYRLLASMDRQKFHSQVVSLVPVGSVGEQIRNLDINVRSLEMQPGRPTLSGLRLLISWLRLEKPDILQTWLYHADLLGILAGRLAGIPEVVWNIRNTNIDFSQYRQLSGFVVRTCSWVSGWPLAVISNSQAGRDFHVRLGYHAQRWVVIPNGIDTQVFKPDADAPGLLRQELGLPMDTLLIGHFGRYDPMKNQEDFILAAGEMVRSGSEAHFVMVGEDVSESNTALREVVDQQALRGRVHMLGRRDDMPQLAAALDLLSSSSLGEGFPNVVAEAMACEVPCVVTDVGDSAMLVGETGKVVPAGNPTALAQAWENLLTRPQNERKQLGLQARRRIEEHYSLGKMTAAYSQLYRDIIAQSK
jgi:glycosyltransferase involved in cell wall biosynthesis